MSSLFCTMSPVASERVCSGWSSPILKVSYLFDPSHMNGHRRFVPIPLGSQVDSVGGLPCHPVVRSSTNSPCPTIIHLGPLGAGLSICYFQIRPHSLNRKAPSVGYCFIIFRFDCVRLWDINVEGVRPAANNMGGSLVSRAPCTWETFHW
jgi:hypothetical protein